MWCILLLAQLAQGSGLAMYERTARLVGDRYLRVAEFDAEEALGEAAESAEARIPWLLVEVEEERIVLSRGASEATVTVPLHPESIGRTLQTLPDDLELLEEAILSLGEDLPEDVDLPVTLLRGVSRALDKHSVVMHRGRLDRFDERLKGKLVGIGARIGRVDGEMVVREVFDGTPAMDGGLMAGDRVLRVDGISTVGMTVRQTVARIRGPVRTQVALQVRRRSAEGIDGVHELQFIRAEVPIPNVSWRIREDGVGLITIDNFSEQTVRLCRQAIIELEEGTADGLPLVGIVLDLRGNTGGSMIQAADTADLFLLDGVIVKTLGRGGKPVPNLLRMIRAHPAERAPLEPEVPMVILQDARSASASEILAGALTMLDKAIIIGRTSHGKGTVQKLYVLRSGEEKVRLKLTVAEYHLAEDVPVHGTGLTPDLTVRRVVFNRSGASIPGGLDDDVVLDVDEREGWRGQDRVDPNADPLMDVAARLLMESAGPSRQAILDALDRLLPGLRREADDRVVSTFFARNLDWSHTDEEPQVLEASVALSFSEPVRSGERVEVKAVVTNLGPAPLYRVRARLHAGSSGWPWDGVTIPIGYLPSQERGIGTAVVALPIGRAARQDLVGLTLEADGLDPLELDKVSVRITGRQAPPMAVHARLVPHEDHHRVELELSNRGTENLTGVRARFVWQEQSGLELVDNESRLPALAAGTTGRADLALRVLDPELTTLPLQLRVEAEQFQEVLRVPIELPMDGSEVTVVPPTIAVTAPVSAPIGNLRVGILAEDDSRVNSLTVWWKGEKIAYGAGDGARLRLDLDLPLEVGSHRLSIVAWDDEGNRIRKVRYIRGETTDEPGAAVVE